MNWIYNIQNKRIYVKETTILFLSFNQRHIHFGRCCLCSYIFSPCPFSRVYVLTLSLFLFLSFSFTFVDGLLAEHDFYQGHSRYVLFIWHLYFCFCSIKKFHSGLFLTSIILICDGQFLTPDQLREQHDLGYAARTHYELSGSRRTDMFDRVNPDYLLRGALYFFF